MKSHLQSYLLWLQDTGQTYLPSYKPQIKQQNVSSIMDNALGNQVSPECLIIGEGKWQTNEITYLKHLLHFCGINIKRDCCLIELFEKENLREKIQLISKQLHYPKVCVIMRSNYTTQIKEHYLHKCTTVITGKSNLTPPQEQSTWDEIKKALKIITTQLYRLNNKNTV